MKQAEICCILIAQRAIRNDTFRFGISEKTFNETLGTPDAFFQVADESFL
jgi:hypothetical protein